MNQDDSSKSADGGDLAESRMFLNLGGEEEPELESSTGLDGAELGAGSSKPKVSSQGIVVIAVLLAAAGAIYGMRKLGTMSGASAETVSIDYNLDPTRGADFERRYATVMDQLEQSGRPVQVPTDEMKKSPFTFVEERPIDELDVDPEELARLQRERDELERRRKLAEAQAEREREIDEGLDALELQGILVGGSRPVARINGKPVAVGSKLSAGLFKVVRIDGRQVVVEADGRRWSLSMGEPAREIE